MAQKGLIDEKPIRYNQVGRVSWKASGIKTILSNLDEFKTVFKYSQFGFGCVEVMIRRIAKRSLEIITLSEVVRKSMIRSAGKLKSPQIHVLGGQ